MTVEKLIDKLNHYPKDMEVKVVISTYRKVLLKPVARVSVGANPTSLWLVGEDE